MTGVSHLGLAGLNLPTLDVPSPELELSNMERQMLIQLAQEGGPLGKVLRYFHDYGAGLRQALAGADLDAPETLKAAKQVQARMQAVAWLLDIFDQQVLTLAPEMENEDEPRKQ